jgi:ATP dependent DNA ligase-like protein
MLQRTLPAGFIAPCLPTKTDTLPSGGLWIHEIKHDGFRIIARKDGERVALYSRPGNDLTRRFPLIVAFWRTAGFSLMPGIISGSSINERVLHLARSHETNPDNKRSAGCLVGGRPKSRHSAAAIPPSFRSGLNARGARGPRVGGYRDQSGRAIASRRRRRSQLGGLQYRRSEMRGSSP